ncbi:hypothetical protein PI124_g4979 [Phytophthora idaei]|nr:hypothetical protein PI125_g4568 [Phytophthora idaei]KAG3142275.1 hypothetical protein PI126_g15110 [Phytophthora idaei]KAG3250402.1 hypothetical protein PI124_g4979 [Phytophthora idaei]
MPTKQRALVQLQPSVDAKRGRYYPVKPLGTGPVAVLRPEVLSMVAYHYFRLTDREPCFDQKTGAPAAPWATECFLKWSVCKPFHWSLVCRNAKPWMASIWQIGAAALLIVLVLLDEFIL